MEKLYHDPKHPAAYGGVNALYNSMKGKKTRKEVKKFLNNSKIYRKYKNVRGKQIQRAKFYTVSAGFNFQADLFDLQKLSRSNQGYKWILLVVDSLSRFVSTAALRNKSGPEVASGMEQIFSDLRNSGRLAFHILLATDLGNEFYNKNVEEVYKKYNIAHYCLRNPIKCGIAEISGRVILRRLHQHMMYKKSKRWIDIIKDVTLAKNMRKNRSLGGLSSAQVTYSNQSEVFEALFGQMKHKKSKKLLDVGQKVQIIMKKLPFSKEIKGYFGEKIYVVGGHRMHANGVCRYTLKDPEDDIFIAGSFYAEELLPY